jgi:acyl-CoA hydrolase
MRCSSAAAGEACAVADHWTLPGAASSTNNSSTNSSSSSATGDAEEGCWLSAAFTFVARSRETGKSTPVCPLLVQTHEEEESFAKVQQRMDRYDLP